MQTTGVHRGADQRKFIRHPASVPIECRLREHEDLTRHDLRDISFGGISFHSRHRFAPGDVVQLDFPTTRYERNVEGIVIWCDPDGTDEGGECFIVGIRFQDACTFFHARLVEQICHIETYRAEQSEKQHREISGEQAAREWIARYADRFPG